jgi:hypothetical protein
VVTSQRCRRFVAIKPDIKLLILFAAVAKARVLVQPAAVAYCICSSAAQPNRGTQRLK